MVSPFQLVVEKLVELGFYEYFFPFIITTAIFYGLLKKSAVLGGSAVINGLVALCAGFLIFGFPFIAGVSLAGPFAGFFTQATVFILIFGLGMLIASLFYPNLQEWLASVFVRRTTLWTMLGLGVALFVTSGLVTVITGFLYRPPAPGVPFIPADLVILASALVIFIILLMIAAATVRAE